MTGSLQDWTLLFLFAAALLAAALYGLAIAGHFPASRRDARFRNPPGVLVLWGTAALTAAATIVTVATAAFHLPLAAAIIAGGISLLLAPLFLQSCSDRFVDGRRGLLLLSAATVVLAALTWRAIP
jgi:hypothetical protein